MKPFTKESDGHYYWLDLIRFLAAFAVMACHFRSTFFVEYSLLPTSQQNPAIFSFYSLTRLGEEAVLVFFVLSGLLVGGKAIKRIVNGSFQIKSFVIDRFVRIMLPLVSALIMYIPIALAFNLPLSVTNWVGSLFSVQFILTGPAFETLWSLSYEVWFYILTFSIGVIMSRRIKVTSYKYAIGCLMLFLAMMVFVKLECYYLFIWILGALALWKILPRNNLILGLSFIVWMITIVLLQYSSGSHFIGDNSLNMGGFRKIISLLFGLSFSIFVQQIIQTRPTNKFLIRLNSVGTKLAVFSYTLYLTHMPVVRLLSGLGFPKSETISLSSCMLYIAEMAIGLIVAYAIYWVFERNTTKVKNFIKAKISKSSLR